MRVPTVLILSLFLLPTPALAQDAGAPPATLAFHGFPCADDGCSGHRVGFDWAAGEEIAAEDECAGETPAFTEGCLAYVRSLTEEHGNESEMDEDYYAAPAEDSASP